MDNEMRVFITGGTGFIGRNLQEKLADRYQIFAPPSSQLNLLDEIAVGEFIKKNHFDVVLHTATWNATRNSPKDLTDVLRNYLKMLFNLARCRNDYGKMVYYGSGAEYDRRFWIPMMREDYFDTHVPVDDYGYSKYVMRQFTETAENIYELCLFGVFGRYEDWEIRFISNACCKAVWDLPIMIKQNVFLDYLYIDDLVKVTEWFMNHTCKERVYNTCTGEPLDLLTLAKMVLAASHKHLDIRIEKEGLGEEYSGDNAKLVKELGGHSFKNLAACIEELFDWYRNKADIDKEKLLLDK